MRARSFLAKAAETRKRRPDPWSFTRKKLVQVFDAAKECGPYDELPVLVDGRDPQVHVSRNDRPQPFFLICSADTVLAQVTGTATARPRAFPGALSPPRAR